MRATRNNCLGCPDLLLLAVYLPLKCRILCLDPVHFLPFPLYIIKSTPKDVCAIFDLPVHQHLTETSVNEMGGLCVPHGEGAAP